MASWRNMFAELTDNIDEYFDALTDGLNMRLRPDPVQIIPFHGYGSVDKLYVRGRVLEDEGIRAAKDKDSMWDNLSAMYLRFESDEIKNAGVEIKFQDLVVETKTDSEGYFEVELDLSRPLSTQRTTDSSALTINEGVWHEVNVRLLDGVPQDQLPITATGKVLVPPAQSQFGIISDMDDTVIQTNAASLLKMAQMTFMNNARTRLPFLHVAELYKALQRGVDGNSYNPIFYVSSSPWNLYDLLVDFMDLQDIPAGPLFLRDFGISKKSLGPDGHHGHKLAQIRRILSTYPALRFILIGDSGQEDPEIYKEVVHEFPNRIAAIYIRDVSTETRDTEVDAIVQEVGKSNVEMVRIADSIAAAKHAAKNGFISSSESWFHGELKEEHQGKVEAN